MATRRLREFLDGSDVRYVIVHHCPAYTASEVAASVHVPGNFLAKVVVAVLGDREERNDRIALAVVPATRDVDFDDLRDQAGAGTVRIADESEFAGRFEGCQLGTVPPFGNLFGVETYVDRSLADQPNIAFNAGTHTDVVVMEFVDFLRLVRPRLVAIATASAELKLYATAAR